MTFDVYSMGFSNRTWNDTIAILGKFEIHRLVDIRTLPGSKHTPQFNQEELRDRLPKAGIEYVHMKNLGGLRKPVKDSSINAAWKNDSFRAYADYMQSSQFTIALDDLVRLLEEMTTVYTCTEALFWRCHRQLVSDALTVRGYQVGHIFNIEKVEQHKLTEFLRAEGTHVTYPSLL
jgi:uncharacterized protein (DUF488 family)